MRRQTSSATIGRRRRWYQFSLRTLIAGMVLVSILLGLLAVRMGRARRQAAAVATIRKHGGHVTYDYAFPDDNPRYSPLQWQAKSNVPNWLLDPLGEDFFHDVVGVAARLNEGMTADEAQDVSRAIETLKEKELGWVTVSE